MKFNEKLKEARKLIGVSQKDVATAIGIERTTYSNYEQGIREPDLATLTKLCIFFNVSADYLLGITDY